MGGCRDRGGGKRRVASRRWQCQGCASTRRQPPAGQLCPTPCAPSVPPGPHLEAVLLHEATGGVGALRRAALPHQRHGAAVGREAGAADGPLVGGVGLSDVHAPYLGPPQELAVQRVERRHEPPAHGGGGAPFDSMQRGAPSGTCSA
jgi:hypothetical protein